jgi:hypothetical protein
MKLHELIFETPLPDDWDKEIYDPRVPFKKRIAYAKAMASRVGQGSSRIAFKIPYQGRDTILKVAKNRKGVAQNEAESDVLNDYVIDQIGIMIPMIDHDENGFTWIHTELATKVTLAQFKAACGGSPDDLVEYAARRFPNDYKKRGYTGTSQIKNINPEADLTERFIEYVGNYIPNISDYVSINNWGLYNGNIVIIDVGFNDDVQQLYFPGSGR